MQDSMFENYDEKCEKRIRSSFRLPPLFVGRTDDYTFASAFASYMVAEAQVFEPERMEFDELMNVTVMKELNPDYEFRSLPMSVKNVDNQLKALEIASNKGAVDNETLIDGINEAVNLDLTFKEEEEPEPPVMPGVVPNPAGAPQPPMPADKPVAGASAAASNPNPGNNPPTKAPVKPAQKGDSIDTFELVELAKEFAAHISGDMVQDERHIRDLKARVATLSKDDQERFDSYVAMRTMSGFDHDPEGATELCSHAGDLLTS
jgi:acyl carrier protein